MIKLKRATKTNKKCEHPQQYRVWNVFNGMSCDLCGTRMSDGKKVWFPGEKQTKKE